MAKRQKRVLLALGWYDYRLHQGIEKYAQEHGWHLYADFTREKVIPWGWEGDGILAWLGAGDDLAEFVSAAKKPTVDFSFRRPQLKFPRVLEDHAHAAQLVADHFLTRGFTNFCFTATRTTGPTKNAARDFSRRSDEHRPQLHLAALARIAGLRHRQAGMETQTQLAGQRR